MQEKTSPLSILVLNQNWFVEELRALGHRVLSIGWTDNKNDLKFECPSISIQEVFDTLPKAFNPDVVVYMDDSGPISVVGLEDLEIPTVFYSVDAHHHISWHERMAGVFDCVLMAQKVFLENFQRNNSNSQWFPLWASQTVEPEPEKTIDVCFRGNLDRKLHPQRADFFEELATHVNLDAKIGNYMDAFPKAKIVVNQAVKKDLNFRVFETLMCGALLLTPDSTAGLDDLFEDGVDLVTYKDGDVKDAAEKIKYYLEYEAERQAIAESGRNKVIQSHTKAARAKQLEGIIQELSVSERPMKYACAASALYVASRKARKLSDALADRFLHEAVRCVIASSERQEALDNPFLSTLHYCKYDFEKRGKKEDSINLIQTVFSHYQNEVVIGLSLAETLLHYGMPDQANAVVARFTQNPAELIAQIPNALMPIRKEILSQLSKDAEIERLEREKLHNES